MADGDRLLTVMAPGPGHRPRARIGVGSRTGAGRIHAAGAQYRVAGTAHPEAGSGTVLVLGLVAVLAFSLAAVLGLTSVAASAGRAASAADLAALAAADAARGIVPGDPCALAGDVAGRNGAEVTQCRRSGPNAEIVDIWTSVALDPGFAWLEQLGASATGRSRAGPPPQPWELPR